MFNLTTSQAVSSVLILSFIICYFGANTVSTQNAFIYLFSIAIVMLIVGN
jgi:hypothetical protein